MKNFLRLTITYLLFFSTIALHAAQPAHQNERELYESILQATNELKSARHDLEVTREATHRELYNLQQQNAARMTVQPQFAAPYNNGQLYPGQAPAQVFQFNLAQNAEVHATQAAQQDASPHVETTNQAQNEAVNVTEVETEVETDVKTDVKTEVKTEVTQSQPVMESVQKQIDSAKGYLGNYKGEIIGILAATIYFGLFAQLTADKYYLNRTDLWSNWQAKNSLEQLCELPQKKLIEQLLLDIQEKYVNPKNPINFVQPLTEFVNDTDYEMARIKKYIKIATLLSRFYLSYILPVSQDTLTLARERLARLAFVRHIFNTWAAEYKVEMAYRPSSPVQNNMKQYA